MDGDEVEWQMFANRQGNLNIVPDKICHNGRQANVSLVLRMMPQNNPQLNNRIARPHGSYLAGVTTSLGPH
jgi:hypothetical protein